MDDNPDAALTLADLLGLWGHSVSTAGSGTARLDAVEALAGYAQPQDRDRAAAAGFDAHLGKPASPEELGAVLARAARERQGGAARP